jgi:hypothetical protein
MMCCDVGEMRCEVSPLMLWSRCGYEMRNDAYVGLIMRKARGLMLKVEMH